MLFLSTMLIFFGSSGVFLNKLIGTTKSPGLSVGEQAGDPRSFDHPWVMVLLMFFAMSMCMPLYKLGVGASERPLPFSPTVFILPSCCDLVGSALTYMALMISDLSTFVMLRSAVVVWTALLSYTLIGRRFETHQLIGIAVTMVGLTTTALASVSSDASAEHDPVLGGALSLASTFFVGLTMVLEEKFVGKYQVPPLLGVGWEGLWGIGMSALLLVVLQRAPGDQLGSFENTLDAVEQVKNSPQLASLLAFQVLLTMGYNGFGAIVGVQLSSAHRVIIDSCKTAVVWGVSLALGWEAFVCVKACGFLLLAAGTCVYNKVIQLPSGSTPKAKGS